MSVTPKRELSLFDSTSIIVGIIIGAGIYQMAPDIAGGVRSPWGVAVIWIVGGLLSLCGALSYAELATAYPVEGGDYVYLNKAYGRWAGFLFGWAQLTVVRPGDIAVMAFAFATYGRAIYDPLANYPGISQRVFAGVAVLALTVINILGVKQGKWTQNLLTTVKALGLLAIVGVAVAAPPAPREAKSAVQGQWDIKLTDTSGNRYEESKRASLQLAPWGAGKVHIGNDNYPIQYRQVESDTGGAVEFITGRGGQDAPGIERGQAALDGQGGLSGTLHLHGTQELRFTAQRSMIPWTLALVFVLFVFGGWNEMAYVAAEVRDPRRSIMRALLLGTASVTVLYLLVNAAFMHVVGYHGLTGSGAIAADTIAVRFPQVGSRLISALVCISALGAVNGLIFTGARISYAMGEDHRVFKVLGRWNQGTGTPVWALAVQGLIAIALILAFGGYLDAVLYTAAAVYAFYLGTSLSVIVLRFKEPGTERPYKVTGYPVTSLVFSGVCAFLVYKSLSFAASNKQIFLIIMAVTLAAGLVIYLLTDARRARVAQPSELGPAKP